MFPTKVAEKIKKKKKFTFTIFFSRKSRPLWDNFEKYCRLGQATGYSMAHAHCVLDT